MSVSGIKHDVCVLSPFDSSLCGERGGGEGVYPSFVIVLEECIALWIDPDEGKGEGLNIMNVDVVILELFQTIFY